jgi:hypothetical protein
MHPEKKSRHISPTPWELPPPNTSWHLTPRRHYLSLICLFYPHCDNPRDNPTTSFDPISGGLGELWILLHCDFCYEKSTLCHEQREWNLLKVDSFFNTNSIISTSYIIAPSKSRAATSSNCSKGGCLSRNNNQQNGTNFLSVMAGFCPCSSPEDI